MANDAAKEDIEGYEVQVRLGPVHIMTLCQCGDVFNEFGPHDEVDARYETWNEAHANCVEKQREGRKVFWMSFCDADLPAGSQFLGACLIDVTAEEADAAAIEVMLRFPMAQPDAEWIAAATSKAHRLGCNPGGQIAFHEMPADHPMLARYTLGVLMDRATIERIDAEIEAAQGDL